MISSDSMSLLFRAKGDSSDARKAFSDLQQSIKKDTQQIEEDVEGSSKKSGAAFDDLTGAAGELSAGFSAAAGVAGIAATAIAGIGAAAIVVGKQLFDLAASAGNVAGEIDKFQKLTSLSIDTIQALKVASERAGESLESIEEIWESFSELMVNAARGEEDAVNKLKRNGIDAATAYKDLEGTFAKALKVINDATPGLRQNAAAMDLMGESGLSIIPTIKQFDGDLAKFTQTLKNNGTIMDAEGIRKAKEFNLEYKALEQQVSGLANTFALEYMPILTNALKESSKWLTANKETFKSWGQSFAEEMTNTSTLLKGVINTWNDATQAAKDYGIATVINAGLLSAIAKDAQQAGWARSLLGSGLLGEYLFRQGGPTVGEQIVNILGGNQQQATVVTPAVTETPLTDPATEQKKREEEAKKRKEAFEKQLNDLKQFDQLKIQQAQQNYEKELKLAEDNLQKQEKALEDYRTRVLNIMADAQRLAVVGKSGQELKNLNLEYQNAVEKLNSDLNNQKAEFGKKQVEAEKKTNEESLKNYETTEKQKTELSKAEIEKRLAAAERQYKFALDINRPDDARAAAMEIYSLKESLAKKEILSLIEVSEKHEKGSARRIELENQIAVLQEKRQTDAIENADEYQRKLFEVIENVEERRLQMLQGLNLDGAAAKAPNGGKADAGGGGGFFSNMIDSWVASLEKLIGLVEGELPSAMGALAEMGKVVEGAFVGIANAIGQVVENFVLYGETGPAVMRKILASALAAIAAEAAVRAIYAAGLGFLYLALGDFYSAGQAFIAAAVFGSIAAGAALAGRAVAGDAFKRQNSGAYGASAGSQGGGTRSGAGGTVYSGGDASTINIGRNTPAEPVRLEISLNSNGVLDVLKENAHRNGGMRGLVLDIVNG